MGMANLQKDSTAATDSVLRMPDEPSAATVWITVPNVPGKRLRPKLAKGERDRRLSLVDPRLRRRALR